MARPKKDKRLSLKVDGKLLEDFQAWTKTQGMNVSAALRQYMRTTVDADIDRRMRIAEFERQQKTE